MSQKEEGINFKQCDSQELKYIEVFIYLVVAFPLSIFYKVIQVHGFTWGKKRKKQKTQTLI